MAVLRLYPGGLSAPRDPLMPGPLLIVSISHHWDLGHHAFAWREERAPLKGVSADLTRIKSRIRDIGCLTPWSSQPLVAVAGAVVGRVEEVRHLEVAEPGPVAAAVCPWGWGTVGRVRGCSQVSLPQEEREQMLLPTRVVIPPALEKGYRPAKQPEYLSRSPTWQVTRTQTWRRPQRRLHPQEVPGCGAQGRCHSATCSPGSVRPATAGTRGVGVMTKERRGGSPRGSTVSDLGQQLGRGEAAAAGHTRQVLRVGSGEGAWRPASQSTPHPPPPPLPHSLWLQHL